MAESASSGRILHSSISGVPTFGFGDPLYCQISPSGEPGLVIVWWDSDSLDLGHRAGFELADVRLFLENHRVPKCTQEIVKVSEVKAIKAPITFIDSLTAGAKTGAGSLTAAKIRRTVLGRLSSAPGGAAASGVISGLPEPVQDYLCAKLIAQAAHSIPGLPKSRFVLLAANAAITGTAHDAMKYFMGEMLPIFSELGDDLSRLESGDGS